MNVNQHFYIPNNTLAGLTVKDNKIVSTFLGSVPDCMVAKPSDKYTASDISRRDEWWDDYAKKITGSNDKQTNFNFAKLLYNNNVFSLSPLEFFALTDSIEKDLKNKDRAQGLVNWLGGGGIYNGVWQKYPCWNDPESYLDTKNITTEHTKTPWSVSDLLSELKQTNPAAHNYVLQKAFAKAKRLHSSDENGYSAFNNQTAKKVKEAAKKVAEASIDIPLTLVKSVTDKVEEAAWIANNIRWIALAVVVGGGYLVWRNRNALAEVAGIAARAAITKGK